MSGDVTVKPLVLADEDAVRDYLDARNDAGLNCLTAGVDVNGGAFLAVLSGPYADRVAVILGNPWDVDSDHGTGTHCEECRAQDITTPATLHYPVTVLTTDVTP